MTRRTIFTVKLLILWCLTIASIELSAKELPDGLTYKHIKTKIHSIHIVDIDPAKRTIVPFTPNQMGKNRETVLNQAKHTKALVAINAGFFLQEGRPSGALKINGTWYRTPHKLRAALGWSSIDNMAFDRIKTKVTAKFGNEHFTMDGINNPRGKQKRIIYTSLLQSHTLTTDEGYEVIVKNDTVQEIDLRMNSLIPHKGWVASFAMSKIPKRFSLIKPEFKASYQVTVAPTLNPKISWNNFENIISGALLLVRNGTIVTDHHVEKTIKTFITKRHARTGLCTKENGHILFVVVDRHPKISDGMTISEFSKQMKTLGCVQALNLDGGGSSTLVINNKLINAPYGDTDEGSHHAIERAVFDTILVK